MASGAAAKFEQVQLPLSWIGMEELPIIFANQFLGVIDDRAEAIISFGQANPPVAIGTPEEMRKQLERLAYIPVKPVARISLSRERMLQLIDVLSQTVKNQEALRKVLDQQGPPKI